MINTKRKITLFKTKSASPDLFSKIQRFFLESRLNQLSRRHLNRHKQLVVFSFDYVSTAINIDGAYEIDELDVLFGWLKIFMPQAMFNGTALDVGANIGNHSLYFSDYFTNVFSFEPQPLTFELLKLNSRLAHNIKCFNFGLSSSEKKESFVVDKKNMGGSHIVSAGSSTGVSLNLMTLDSLTEVIPSPVRLIKIDVEGHEHEVLLGAKEVIMNNQPIIIFEQHESDFIGNSSKSIDLIRSFNYTKFAYIEKSPSPHRRLPYVLKLVYSTISRLINGSSRSVVMVDEFVPNFYPFIIAIPDWLVLDV